MLELYFRARQSPSVPAKVATATLVLIAAAATSIGVYGRIGGWLR